MKVNSIYIRDLAGWDFIPSEEKDQLEWVFCGDYGCPKVLPSLEKLVQFREGLGDAGPGLHYISPKVNQAVIEEEAEKLIGCIKAGIGISINDWGLLYKVRNEITPGSEVFIGRLLTKSISEWVWSSIFLEKETSETIKYFMQNNFNHKIKIEYFSQWNIKGVELNISADCEESYKEIKDLGFEVIGFVDNPILSVSRACPVARLNERPVNGSDCETLCGDSFEVSPMDPKQKEIYPGMTLVGNVIFAPTQAKPQWDGYYKLVKTWN